MTNGTAFRDVRVSLQLAIADGFPTFRPDVTALFGKYLPQFGINADLVTRSTRENWRADAVSWAGGKVFASPWHASRWRRGLAAMVYIPWHILRSSRRAYSAIQARDSVTSATIGLIKARATGLAFFYWMSFPRYELLGRLARTNGMALGIVRYLGLAVRGRLGAWLLYHFVLPASDHVFVQSDTMLADLTARGISPQKMTAVPMGVDPDRFVDRPTPELPDPSLKNRRIVAYLGACGAIRRVDFLIDVASELRGTFPDILLLLIGDADERAEKKSLRRSISEKGMDDFVIVTGWLEQEKAHAYLAQAEVALALMPPDPILDSTTPTKLVEYLAMGRPVVANEHPDQTSILQESEAGICVPFDRNAFANAVKCLLDDRALARRCAEAGPRYVLSRRNYRSMAETLSGVYKRLLA